ncbi:hypothetical protein BHE97_15410 [Aeromicrobium sp. PE09-221]|uniref:hypothetical protein n=1 Tax=Aeromicrobium sp. PE09-221 TaxID=1898043 RepID=UPI000B3ECD3D|nr:hypothetical protein [Aeromicrobium sp. PE09-221]OUZ07773.1 hypothetical protein BHE97_15410 [Aeromicrobium sp. PE09-221]
MSEERQGAVEPRGVEPPRWARRAVVIMVALLLALGAYALAAAFLPRWWGERIGALIGGSTPTGVLWGMLFGAVFTALPVFLLAFVLRPRWKVRVALVLLAVVVAVPNLLTLSVVLGGNDAARDGRDVWSREAPGFVTGTWVGAAVGALVSVLLILARWSAVRRRRQLGALRHDLEVSSESDRLHREEADRLRRVAGEREDAERRRDEPPDLAENR